MVATRSSNEDKPTLLVRADAGPEMGTGHVMRCLALAQAWQDAGGAVIFLARLESPVLVARLRSEGMEVVPLSAEPGAADDSARAVKLAQERNVSWVVVDGYQFGEDYQKAIKGANHRLLFLDDYGHAGRYWADIVLNSNLSAREPLYAARQPQTRLLLGTPYVLLRREFLRWKNWSREIPAVAAKVLVTLGGGDAEAGTLMATTALDSVHTRPLQVRAVVGFMSPPSEKLDNSVDQSRHQVRVEKSVGDMPELMSWADLAISGGGSTCWELAFMGLPGIALAMAKCQEAELREMDRSEFLWSLGTIGGCKPEHLAHSVSKLISSPELRRQLSQKGRELVDGLGAHRVVNALRGIDCGGEVA